jgi:hypothetical protein
VTTEPRQGQLPIGPLVAALGAVLLIVSLFLDWYDGYTGFTVFEFIDLLLALLALATIAALASGFGMARAAVSPGAALAVAGFAIFLVLSQIINDPPAVIGPGPDKGIGIWLALSGSALMVAGGVLGYSHISLAVEARPRAAPPPSEPVDHEGTTIAERDPEAAAGSRAEAGRWTSGAGSVPGREPAPPEDRDPTRPLSDPDAPPPPRGGERP